MKHNGMGLQVRLDPAVRLCHQVSSPTASPGFAILCAGCSLLLGVPNSARPPNRYPATQNKASVFGEVPQKSWSWILLDHRLITEPVTVSRSTEDTN